MTVLSKFLRDERASMTLEFVVVLPLMVVWFIGSIVFFDAFKARMDAEAAISTITDIASRQKYLNMEFLEEMAYLQQILLNGSPSTWFRISIIKVDAGDDRLSIDDDTYEVIYSRIPDAYQGSELQEEDVPRSQIGLRFDGEQIILLDSLVAYEPMVDWVRIGSRNWQHRKASSIRSGVVLPWCEGSADDCDIDPDLILAGSDGSDIGGGWGGGWSGGGGLWGH